MSSRQLWSKGESDGLSLPAPTRKGRGKKLSNQPVMEQQQQDQLQQHATVQISPLPNQPRRPASTQLTAGESATPSTGQADRSSLTPLQDTGLMQLPPVNIVPPPRAGTPQIFFNNNTQDSGSHVSNVWFSIYSIYVVPTGMEEAPKVAPDIHCLCRGGGAALTQTIN